MYDLTAIFWLSTIPMAVSLCALFCGSLHGDDGYDD